MKSLSGMCKISFLILIAGGELIKPFPKIKRVYGAQINVLSGLRASYLSKIKRET